MKQRITLVILIAVLVALPLVPGTPEFWITQLNYIGLASLVSLGLVLLTGVGGLTSFGQAAFVGIGAYATAVYTTRYGGSPWVGLLIGLALTGGLALFIGAITLRLSGHYLPLGTIAWGIALYFLFGNIEWLGKYDGISGIEPLDFLGVSLASGRRMFYMIWGLLLLAVLATSNLLDSRPGRAIRALKSGAAMAESFGVHTAGYKVIIFVYAALLASVSGWLFAHMQRAVSPNPFGLLQGISYLFMAVVGGAGYVWGALMGSAVILTLRDQIQNLAPRLLHTDANVELIVFGVLLVVMLQYAQDGLWPIVSSVWSRLVGSPSASRRAAPPTAPRLPSRARPEAGQPILGVDGIRKEFGGLVAVNDLSFALRAGEIVGLIGPNGAGKSTTFNLITGVTPLTAGAVTFMGERIDGQLARKIAGRGVSRTFQHVQLLAGKSVLENVALGAHLRTRVGVAQGCLRLDRAREAQILYEASVQCQRVGLGDSLHELAGNLPLGQQRILEIARALASDPLLLLLDEPAAGLRYKEKQDLARVLGQLRDEGLGILLVEHDMDFVMRLTNHLVVMDFGAKLAEGPPADIQRNAAVLEAYLGGLDDSDPLAAASVSTATQGGAAMTGVASDLARPQEGLAQSGTLLEIDNFAVRYGLVEALAHTRLEVRAGSIVTVIGANGAGKSTMLNGIMGALPGIGHASGIVRYEGVDVQRWEVERRVSAGMSLVPEKRELFASMTVRDNLLLGGFRRYRARERHWMESLDEVYTLFPRLKEREQQLAGTLSGGERQMLAVGRALMSKPRLLMLDEPSLGLAPRIVREIFEVIGRLRDSGVSILLVEQNARAALQIADYGYVLETGSVALEGPAHELAGDPRVIESYLGLGRA